MIADYVIVGAGPAACVLAWRLSADRSRRVLVLEAGTRRPSLLRRAMRRAVGRDTGASLWPYQTVPQPGLDGRRVYLPQGKVLGGGSAVNAMTYVRGHPSDYARWREAGNAGWDPGAVLAAFRRIEHNHSIADEFHGRDGPLDVSDQVSPHRLSRAFVETAHELGLAETRDFNGARAEGLGLYQVTQRRGRRVSAADAFLDAARGRPNLTVLDGAFVTRIVLQGRRASGVEFRRGGRTALAQADEGVLVSGGAINSPKLLLLSGIGPADELHRAGIPVAHELPGVGRNLHDHLNVQVIVRARDPITRDHWDRPLALLRSGLEYLFFNSGFATSNLCEAGGFLRSTPDLSAPDFQLHFMPLIWRDYGRARQREHGVTLEIAPLRPDSRGRVTLGSADPEAEPLIDPGYCAAPGDLDRLVDAIRRGRRIMAAEAMTRWTAEELHPGAGCRSDAELAAYVRRTAVTAYHPVGSCRMGVDRMAVVDPRLRVPGLEGLRVVDSSIMPSVVSGSTQAPAMMIGEMGATMLLEDGG